MTNKTKGPIPSYYQAALVKAEGLKLIQDKKVILQVNSQAQSLVDYL